jgi:hypothetical protein
VVEEAGSGEAVWGGPGGVDQLRGDPAHDHRRGAPVVLVVPVWGDARGVTRGPYSTYMEGRALRDLWSLQYLYGGTSVR